MPTEHNLKLATISGCIDGDVRIRATTNGQVASFTLAVKSVARKDEGQNTITSWHKVSCFRPELINILGTFGPGTPLLVRGYLTVKSWTDENEQKRYMHEVVARGIYPLKQEQDEDVNECVLTGTVRGDVSSRFTNDGTQVVSFTILVTDTMTKNGEQVTKMHSHKVSCFKKETVEIAKNLNSGDWIAVEGSVRIRSWVNEQTGLKKVGHEIISYAIITPTAHQPEQQSNQAQEDDINSIFN